MPPRKNFGVDSKLLIMIKAVLSHLLKGLGYEIRKIPPANSLYRPLYSPWHSTDFARYYAIAAPRTLVSVDRCFVLERLFRQTLPIAGDIFECGVYRGGTAALLAALLAEEKSEKRLFLFDTFAGMPATDPERDWHREGNFSDTSLEAVQSFVRGGARCILRKGLIPETFAGLSDVAISFCHIDLDIYKSTMDSVAFIWPRLSLGGAIVFDDYGFVTCPGAKQAVDDFFRTEKAVPVCLQTGQAIVFKGTPSMPVNA